VRTLSLTQPWSSLVVWGAKHNETRDWKSAYRGPLAIHASIGFPRWAIELCFEQPFSTALHAMGITTPAGLPRGMVLGTVELVDCVAVETLLDRLTATERAFGNYDAGRYAWVLENPHRFEIPIPAKGSLGLWEWTGDPDGIQALR